MMIMIIIMITIMIIMIIPTVSCYSPNLRKHSL